MVDKTGELHKAAILRCYQNRCSYIFRDIHRKSLVLEHLFNKAVGLRLPTKVFSCKNYKTFKNNFFNRTPRLAAFDCSNQSKIFREITASKIQGQHATQFNRYEGQYAATKTEIHRGFFNGTLRNFRSASFENNF